MTVTLRTLRVFTPWNSVVNLPSTPFVWVRGKTVPGTGQGDRRVGGLDRRDGFDEALGDIVNHDVEALDCPHAQKREVAVFREDHLVDDGEAFGGE